MKSLILDMASGQISFIDDGQPVVIAMPTMGQVDAERDRRISIGFTFNGKNFQSDADSMQNISGAATAAYVAQGQGFLDGNLRWFDANADFAWIAADNSLVPMDAPTVIQFGMAAAMWKQFNIFAARNIKNRIAAGERLSYTDNTLWP